MIGVFIGGMCAGTVLGIGIMCILAVAKDDEDGR